MRSGPSRPRPTLQLLTPRVAYREPGHTPLGGSQSTLRCNAPALHCTPLPPNHDDGPTSPPIGGLNGAHFDRRDLVRPLWKIFI
ncbi:hypothetical protein BD779DRAFT_1089918 [Infundibulicybe gibba]|nr:hypothetical protein BD779DRAFT_1089918 [Infundibulicybe gibba]